MYDWPLNTNNFSLDDRAEISRFILDGKNYWTQDKYVKKFESEMRKFVGSNFAIYCSSGSTANTMLAMYLKDKKKSGRKILFPSTTWTTSVAPFVREGFEPVFIDVEIYDLSIDLGAVEIYLRHNYVETAAVIIVSLLGIVPNIQKINELRKKYPAVEFIMDNCENTFGTYQGQNISGLGITSTTSTYFGHQIQSVEGGFVFTDNEEIYKYCLLARNHGMVRSLPDEHKDQYANKCVDSRFDFNILGSNFRNTDINAFIGRLDLAKAKENIRNRIELYSYFVSEISSDYWIFQSRHKAENVMFCLPILLTPGVSNEKIQKAKNICLKLKIETRPIISGNLLRQTCYSKYADCLDFPCSEYLHNNGFYVGLHSGVKKEQVKRFISELNKL